MTYREKYLTLEADQWFEKAKLIYLYHSGKKKVRKWSVTQTANYFGVSQGYVGDALTIIRFRNKIDTIKLSRKMALKIIRSLH